ncbi:MAG TPA: hypothetical protein VNS63_11780 [Blastocatellia bacterium]|nr:hypothetical protein [Blastocatellia bacterium]
MINKMITLGALALGSMLLQPVVASAQQKQPLKNKPAPRVKSEPKSMPDEPIVCNLFGLTESQRKRQQELRVQLFEANRELRELPDGYAIGLPATAENILAAAEFVTLERLCCSFFRFEIAVGGNAEPLWLRLTGGKDVKEFLKAELLRK